MMDYSYVQALVTRAKWKKWVQEGNLTPILGDGVDKLYLHALTCGDTFFMNRHFCKMVDVARRSVPDGLEFDVSWLQESSGFLWLEDSAELPIIDSLQAIKHDLHKYKMEPKIAAVGWLCLKSITSTSEPFVQFGKDVRRGQAEVARTPAEATAVEFMVFVDFAGTGREGFGPWSYFSLRTGEKVLDRLKEYESNITERGANYVKERATEELHEVRWVYAAFNLMAQRLAMRVRHDTDRATRRRSERENTPVAPFIKVITLRRLEEEREQGITRGVDWQWQWTVSGHWRNQFLPGSGEHKHIWIDSYVKGPPDKPMKPMPMKVFLAKR